MGSVTETRHEKAERFNARPPSDAELWRRRDWPAERWVARTGVQWRTVVAYIRRRRFGVLATGEIHEAPCAGCGTRLERSALSSIRLCDSCGAGTPETLCRQERQGREYQLHLKRLYTPGAKKGPGIHIQRGARPWMSAS